MPPPAERRWSTILAGYVILGGLLGLAATPAYLYAEPANKPLVVRGLAAALVGVVLLHLLRVVRNRIEAQPSSALERALVPARPAPELPRGFLTLRDEVRHSTRSQSYFEHVLWPRLAALAAAAPAGRVDGGPTKPAGRRWLRLGPSLSTLGDLIARLEEHP